MIFSLFFIIAVAKLLYGFQKCRYKKDLSLFGTMLKHCRDAFLQSVYEENVIEVLLGCEKLQLALPRQNVQLQAQRVAKMVRDVEEYCLEPLPNCYSSIFFYNFQNSFINGVFHNCNMQLQEAHFIRIWRGSNPPQPPLRVKIHR